MSYKKVRLNAKREKRVERQLLMLIYKYWVEISRRWLNDDDVYKYIIYDILNEQFIES